MAKYIVQTDDDQETPPQDQKETPEKETPPKAPETPEIPEEKLTSLKDDITKDVSGKVSEQVSKSVLEKIGAALGLTKEEEEELPKDAASLKKLVQQEAQNLLKQRDEEQQKTQQQEDQQLDRGAQTFRELWNRDYTEMANNGMVPKIEKADDPNDPGNQAKTRVLAQLKKVLDENAAKGVDYVPTLWEIMARYPETLKTETTTGANAPVSGGGKSMGAGGDEYQRIHNTPIEDMLSNKQ
jgi:hypothetical protein